MALIARVARLGSRGRSLFRHPAAQWFLAAQLAFAAILGLRLLGALEWMELSAYDATLRLAAGKPRGADRVVLVGATEEDLNRWGWPLSDAVLADALEQLAAMQPRVIMVDLYRDLPRPPGAESLDAALRGLGKVCRSRGFEVG